ncbi:hypothetical protein ACQKCU_01890 [Heyndrickxia sporothermodurans]
MNFNTYWYFGLLILSLLLLGFTYMKKRSKQIFYLYLTMIGYGYIIETTIFNFLGSYNYYPHIVKYPSFYDNNLGAFFSNAFALPASATFIATFHLKWGWMFFFSGIFVGIEWLFMKLNIYSHNWWKLLYTGLGIPFYFAMGKLFFKRIQFPVKGFIQYLIHFLSVSGIYGSAHILPIIFFKNRVYQPGWFVDQGRDSIAFAAIFYLYASLLFCLVVNIHWKTKWTKYILTAFIMLIATLILKQIGLLYSLVWWDTVYSIGLSLLMIKIAQALKNIILHPI